MATFPFTFPHAGRTFSVVSDDRGPRSDGRGAEPDDVYVRILGVRGLHEFGPVEADEPNGRLRDRICRWYDERYGALAPREPDGGD